jgi:hypothetical protein
MNNRDKKQFINNTEQQIKTFSASQVKPIDFYRFFYADYEYELKIFISRKVFEKF